MSKKILVLALAAMFVAPASYAAVLSAEDALVSSSAGKFKDWSLTFFSLATRPNMEFGKEDRSNRSIFTYDYFSINFKADSTQRYSLRLPFGFTTPGYKENGDEQKTADFQMQDIHFVYSNYDLGYVGPIDLSGKAKAYLPTSVSTAAKKTIGYLRFEGYADYSIARNWSVAYVAKPDIYLQTQTASGNSGSASGTKQFELAHYLQLQWDVHPVVTLSVESGFEETWYHSSAAEDVAAKHDTYFKNSINAWIRPTRTVSFTLVMSNSTDLSFARNDKINFVEPHNTEYLLLTNVALF